MHSPTKAAVGVMGKATAAWESVIALMRPRVTLPACKGGRRQEGPNKHFQPRRKKPALVPALAQDVKH